MGRRILKMRGGAVEEEIWTGGSGSSRETEIAEK